jgi:hypothetical protein
MESEIDDKLPSNSRSVILILMKPILSVVLLSGLIPLVNCSKAPNTESNLTPSRPTDDQIAERKANQILKEAQERKLQTIVLPDIKFTNLRLLEAIGRLQCVLCENPQPNPQRGKGIAVIIRMKSDDGYKVTIDMKAPKLGEVYKEIARQSNLRLLVSPYALVLAPKHYREHGDETQVFPVLDLTEQDAAANPSRYALFSYDRLSFPSTSLQSLCARSW